MLQKKGFFRLTAVICIYFIPALSVASPFSATTFYTPTSKENCSTVDFNTVTAIQNWKHREQDGLEWCYAHTSADFLQLQFRLPEQISSADIAIRYNLSWMPQIKDWAFDLGRKRNPESTTDDPEGKMTDPIPLDPPQTGIAKWAMENTLAEGYCPESAFPSDYWLKVFPDGKTQSVHLRSAIRDSLKLVLNYSQNSSSPAFLPYTFQFQNVSPEQFTKLVLRSDTGNFLDQLRQAACEGQRKSVVNSQRIRMFPKGPWSFERINWVMSLHQPVVIDFFYDVLLNVDHYKRTIPYLHTTLLMGRRWNETGQECEYEIRDTYGTDCSPYDRRLTCRLGQIWISESQLKPALVNVTYLQP
jgi:hypothetical protein